MQNHDSKTGRLRHEVTAGRDERTESQLHNLAAIESKQKSGERVGGEGQVMGMGGKALLQGKR